MNNIVQLMTSFSRQSCIDDFILRTVHSHNNSLKLSDSIKLIIFPQQTQSILSQLQLGIIFILFHTLLKMSNFKIGKLKFKDGGAKPAHVPKKVKKTDKNEDQKEEDVITEGQVIRYEPKPGKGMITSSGRTIHGNDTKFRQEIDKGDSIIIQNPVFKTTEERTVTLVLSDKSILLEQPFLEEYSSYVQFMIRKKATVIEGKNLTKQYQEKLEELGKTKGIKKDELSVRLKKGMWSYETKKVEIGANLSREGLLDVREKLIKDKHCW